MATCATPVRLFRVFLEGDSCSPAGRHRAWPHVFLWLGLQRLGLAVGVLAVLTLALCGWGGWQMTHRPDMGYARALGAIDATLAQTWGSMPKTLQEQLN